MLKNFQAVIHDFLFHWGINMRWHRGHILLFIHQHGKDKNMQIKQECVELHNSGNGYNKIAIRLKMPISTVRATLIKFKATGNVTNLPGRGPICIFPPCTVRRMIRKAKNSNWRITKESGILGLSSLQNYN